MIILTVKFDEVSKMTVTQNLDGSYRATFYENDMLLGHEDWKYLSELIEEYC